MLWGDLTSIHDQFYCTVIYTTEQEPRVRHIRNGRISFPSAKSIPILMNLKGTKAMTFSPRTQIVDLKCPYPAEEW